MLLHGSLLLSALGVCREDVGRDFAKTCAPRNRHIRTQNNSTYSGTKQTLIQYVRHESNLSRAGAREQVGLPRSVFRGCEGVEVQPLPQPVRGG